MHSQDPEFIIPRTSQTAATTHPRWYRRWWGVALIAIGLLIAILAVALAFYVGRVAYLLRTEKITPQELFGGSAPVRNLPDMPTYATSDDPSFGVPNAKVVIVEFSDFQCPFCKQAAPVVKQIMADYDDKVLFVYRDFPIESLHPQAVAAAVAAECAHRQGLFWEMHDELFANQDDLSDANLKRLAVRIGANSIQFSSCLDGRETFTEVQQDFTEGVSAEVTATPTFFINGMKIEGVITYAAFEQIILSELSRR